MPEKGASLYCSMRCSFRTFHMNDPKGSAESSVKVVSGIVALIPELVGCKVSSGATMLSLRCRLRDASRRNGKRRKNFPRRLIKNGNSKITFHYDRRRGGSDFFAEKFSNFSHAIKSLLRNHISVAISRNGKDKHEVELPAFTSAECDMIIHHRESDINLLLPCRASRTNTTVSYRQLKKLLAGKHENFSSSSQ